MKRTFDLLFSATILFLFFPFGLLIAVFIKLDSKGSVFFFQTRIGRNGKPFQLWKFRTMFVNAQAFGTLTVGMRDPRITRVGYHLRRLKLDEFPQFVNVLLGEMSVVGPRPETPDFVKLYTDEQRKVLSVSPGITDFASLKYFTENEILEQSNNPKETYINEVMPQKLQLNLKYIENQKFSTDLKIIGATFLKIFGIK